MRPAFMLMTLLFVSTLGFAQNIRVGLTDSLPGVVQGRFYIIQVGAFRDPQNAAGFFTRLSDINLTPSYESHLDFIRVVVAGVSANNLHGYIQRIRAAGFSEVFIRTDYDVGAPSPVAQAPLPPPPASVPESQVPQVIVQTPESAPEPAIPEPSNIAVSAAALPQRALREIAHRSVRVGETRTLRDLTANRNVAYWRSSTPSTVSVDNQGNITGLGIGNAYIQINDSEFISVVVTPVENFFVVPDTYNALLPQESRAGNIHTSDLVEYTTEPTHRLAYRFNNRGENRGASGTNGGIDIMARGPNYEWVWTTFQQGGWFYDLNGIRREMVNGHQRSPNGVELTLAPEFIYQDGVPYLQIRHIVRNTSNTAVTGQRFGAGADIMINENDYAPLFHTPFGAYMADSETNPTVELIFISTSGEGITPVDTLWLGSYNDGAHLNFIYTDRRATVRGVDSAIAFSYQNIDLEAGEVREFIVRFTLIRAED